MKTALEVLENQIITCTNMLSYLNLQLEVLDNMTADNTEKVHFQTEKYNYEVLKNDCEKTINILNNKNFMRMIKLSKLINKI